MDDHSQYYKLMNMKKSFLSEVVLLTKSYNLQDFKDWLYWHLDIIGFQRCHVFDNESSVDIKSECKKYGERVSYELIRGWPDQYALYERYINNESPAWWVLPIDDDEFLYVDTSYEHNVNRFLLNNYKRHPDWCKVCIGWRNMFPEHFTDARLNEHMVLNATGWSNTASEVWQCGNRPVKTFVNTAYKYSWTDNGAHRTHNPIVVGRDLPGYTLNGEKMFGSHQVMPTRGSEDLILYHYQFKCDAEWKMKCAKRGSPGAKWFKKNYPEKYAELYKGPTILRDLRMANVWSSGIQTRKI